MRRLKGILRGCDGDMTAFEDVGIRAVAAYENTVLNSAGTSEDNVTEVGGALSTVSGNLTASSGSGAGTGSGTGSNSSSNTTKKSGGLRVGNGTGSAGIAALVMSFMLAGMVALL